MATQSPFTLHPLTVAAVAVAAVSLGGLGGYLGARMAAPPGPEVLPACLREVRCGAPAD